MVTIATKWVKLPIVRQVQVIHLDTRFHSIHTLVRGREGSGRGEGGEGCGREGSGKGE